MSKNTSKTLTIGTQIDGYVIYAVYADKLALGRVLSPDGERQYALIANKRYFYNTKINEWFIRGTYTEHHIAEKDFVNRCFSWSNFNSKEPDEPELPAVESLFERILQRHCFSSDDDRDKMKAAIKETKEIRDSIRHLDEV